MKIQRKRSFLFIFIEVDSHTIPSTSTQTADSHLLSVDECDYNESTVLLPVRQRSSTCTNSNGVRSRESMSMPRKSLEDRLRRRSWMACLTNNCSTPDAIIVNQQTLNLLRLKRFRLGQSEPNLSSLQSTPISSTKTSPRTSTAATTTTTTTTGSSCLSQRSSMRRPNLSGSNLIHLKNAFRKQLSPQQQQQSSNQEPTHDLSVHDDQTNRRWSLTSAPSSSGYGTTSPPSSQYSSFERLQHQQFICTCISTSDIHPHDDSQHLESRSISMSLLDANISSISNKMLLVPDQDINTMAYIYKERYPKAKVQMEERLQNFLDTYKSVDKFEYCSDGSARFIHNQIIELAKDCLEKSHNDLITSFYFTEMTDNLERLLLNAKEKCPQAIEHLQTVVRKLLLTTARSARLLECLHFDPENFLRTLEEIECQAKTITTFKQDIPKYICSQLNLERNPLDIIENLQTTDNENEANYLTITANSNNLLSIEHSSSSVKGPCEEDFEVLKLISNGAYGAVHLVRNRQTQERYAMKKISKTNLILRNQIEQVFVERDIMTFTDNPFVVALICTFETKNHLCLVMEYVEGGDVATLLKNIGGPLNIDIARMYFAETTLAVEYLHSYGIIHRDLKPDNLLITSLGHIKLTDFGLSKIGLMSLTTNLYEKLVDKDTKIFQDKQICGTPTYIAPEVILRQGYGKPVDWWSLGIILYEFLVGIPPFTGNTPDELFANVITGEIDWQEFEDESEGEGFCPDARNLIEQLLEHHPSKPLGTSGGALEIRSHPFCSCINWNSLLCEKADFVPVLESLDDTSYFDTRTDRYKHSDNDDDDNSSVTTNNDSDSLFASFSSVSMKYVSELSGTHKQRHSSKQDNDSSSSRDVSRANSCTDSIISNVIRIDSPNDFQPLMSQSMTEEKTDSSSNPPIFGSGTFEPILLSSDESEQTSSYSSKTPDKHYKQRKSSLKLMGEQNSLDSGDDQDNNRIRHHKKSRIPRALSPIQTKQSNISTPIVSISNENVPTYKTSKYTSSQQRHFPRSLSKSFSSSSSSSNSCNQEDRIHRQTHRHNMAVSPLERDTTLKSKEQSSHLATTKSPINSIKSNLRPPIIIHRGPRSFGFTLRAVKVFHGNTDYYTTQHVVVAVSGPAEAAGLKANDVITHVNEQSVVGLIHSDVVKLILSGSNKLSIRAIPASEAQIRQGGRRRSPSKQKIRYQQTTDKKTSSPHHDNQHRCLKHRLNSFTATTTTPSPPTGSNSNRKNSHNTSLFRRLSERKVARDIEAAAAAGVSLSIPMTIVPTPSVSPPPTTSPATSSSNNANVLSSSLPLLSFNQLSLDPSEWPTLKSPHKDSTPLPSIIKQKSQVRVFLFRK